MLSRVDVPVAGDHPVGEGDVGVEQSGGGGAHGGADGVRHLHQAGVDVLEFLAVVLAHGWSLLVGPSAGPGRSWVTAGCSGVHDPGPEGRPGFLTWSAPRGERGGTGT
jgi:hypothetical protein